MLKLLAEVAEKGKLVCDSFETRKLWYAELVYWSSLTEISLTAKGLAILYRAEENGEL